MGNKNVWNAMAVNAPTNGTGYTVSADKTTAVKDEVITLTFTSTVAAGATADVLTVTPTNATAVAGNTVTFAANDAVGTVKTIQFKAGTTGPVSFAISGTVANA